MSQHHFVKIFVLAHRLQCKILNVSNMQFFLLIGQFALVNRYNEFFLQLCQVFLLLAENNFSFD